MTDIFFTGSFSDEKGPGITSFSLDPESGKALKLFEYNGIFAPTYLTVDKKRKMLYSVSEREPGGREHGFVQAFSIDVCGSLTPLGSAAVTGYGATHIASNGKYLATVEYYTGDVDLFSLGDTGDISAHISNDRHTGSGPVADRQDCAHAHFVGFDPFDKDKLYSVDLGTDTIYIYDVSRGCLEIERKIKIPDGEGPRHLLFSKKHPGIFYCVCEITFNVMVIEKKGGRIIACLSAIEDGFNGFGGAAAIRLDENEEHLYISNRVLEPKDGGDSLAIFSLDEHGLPRDREIIKTGYHFPRDMNVFTERNIMAVAYQLDNILQIRKIDKSGRPDKILFETACENVCCISDLVTLK